MTDGLCEAVIAGDFVMATDNRGEDTNCPHQRR
jgi:hypothetical protein